MYSERDVEIVADVPEDRVTGGPCGLAWPLADLGACMFFIGGNRVVAVGAGKTYWPVEVEWYCWC